MKEITINRSNVVILIAAFMLPVFIIPATALPNETGIEPISVFVNAKLDGTVFNPNDKITVPTGREMRLSIMFRSISTADDKYIIRAPFAKVITTTSGTISDENGISMLDISISRGQSFTLDFVGTVTEATYIDIFKTGSNTETVNHFTVVPDTAASLSGQVNTPGRDHGALDRQISIAEDNLNKLKKLGAEFPLLESNLETAKLYGSQNNDRANQLLEQIITQTSQVLDRYNNLKDRLDAVKEIAANTGTLDKVSPYIVSAERALEKMNLDGAEKHIADAENIANPGWLQTIINLYGTYIGIAIILLIVAFLWKRFMSGDTVVLKP